MESKKGFGKLLQQIIEGRGFYIVMALCAAVIGVSIWSLVREPADYLDEAEFEDTLSAVEVMPADTPEPTIFEEPEETPITEPTEEAAETAASTEPVWPVEGSVQRDYSMDHLAYDATMADWRTHDGLDIEAPLGTKVLAIKPGKVQSVYFDDAYGSTVVIDHGNGLTCTYAALEEIPTVIVGDTVNAGDVIGSVGDTAKCETAQSAHLHLAAKVDGQSISPLDCLPKIG